jgi:hypothetical protein
MVSSRGLELASEKQRGLLQPFRYYAAFCQHIPRRCFFIIFADVAATLFRNLLLSLAREKLPRQKLIGVSYLGPIHFSEAGGTRLQGRDSVAS